MRALSPAPLFVDCGPQGSSVRGNFQARTLEWVVNSSSRGSSQPRDRTHVSYISCISSQVFFFFLSTNCIELYKRKASILIFDV